TEKDSDEGRQLHGAAGGSGGARNAPSKRGATIAEIAKARKSDEHTILSVVSRLRSLRIASRRRTPGEETCSWLGSCSQQRSSANEDQDAGDGPIERRRRTGSSSP